MGRTTLPQRALAAALLCSAVAASAAAVQPKFWKLTSVKDFLSGELSGTALASPGTIRMAPRLRRLAGIDEAVVLAAVADGDGGVYLATGNRGKIYRVRASGAAEVVATLPEVTASALALDAGGNLYAAGSPGGIVYRIERGGAPNPWYATGERFVWALSFGPDGALYAGTGTAGKIFRVTGSTGAKGSGELWFDAQDTNIVALAWRGNELLAGGQGQGHLYRIAGKNSGWVLFDSNLTEVTAIAPGANGMVYAAAMYGDPTLLAPPAPPKEKPEEKGSAGSGAAADGKSGESTGEVTVQVSYDTQPVTVIMPRGGTTAELYAIHPDGYVETKWQFQEDVVYALAWRDGAVRLGTGLGGKLFEHSGSDMTLAADLEEKQIAELAGGLLVTSNPVVVYREEAARAEKGTYVSPVEDAQRFTRWGTFSWEGDVPAGASLRFAFRAGNSAQPDATWTPWRETASRGPARSFALTDLPGARFVQWRAELVAGAGGSPVVTEATLAYANRNVPPVVDAILVHDPGVVYLRQTLSGGQQVFDATSPDKQGIFAVLEDARERGDGMGKKLWKKGWRTVSWKATDANADGLRFDVFFRPLGISAWAPLRKDLDDDQLSFDSTSLPDGRYELRVVARDDTANPPASAGSGEKVSPPVLVDNTPPEVRVGEASGGLLSVRVEDRYNPVAKLEYSTDAERWIELVPEDGIADSPAESYVLALPAPGSEHFVIFRASDTAFNIGSGQHLAR